MRCPDVPPQAPPLKGIYIHKILHYVQQLPFIPTIYKRTPKLLSATAHMHTLADVTAWQAPPLKGICMYTDPKIRTVLIKKWV